MSRRVTGEGRQVVAMAQAQARRLGHQFIGCEHLVYGLACVDSDVGAILRTHGVSPQRYEAQFVDLVGGNRSAAGRSADDPFEGAALKAIGIDLDVVRDQVESVFGPGALNRTRSEAAHRGLTRRRRMNRRPGHLPVTRRAKKCLARALHGERSRESRHLVPEEIALAVLAMNRGLVPRILSAMGTSSSGLHAEILGQYQRAG